MTESPITSGVPFLNYNYFIADTDYSTTPNILSNDLFAIVTGVPPGFVGQAILSQSYTARYRLPDVTENGNYDLKIGVNLNGEVLSTGITAFLAGRHEGANITELTFKIINHGTGDLVAMRRFKLNQFNTSEKVGNEFLSTFTEIALNYLAGKVFLGEIKSVVDIIPALVDVVHPQQAWDNDSFLYNLRGIALNANNTYELEVSLSSRLEARAVASGIQYSYVVVLLVLNSIKVEPAIIDPQQNDIDLTLSPVAVTNTNLEIGDSIPIEFSIRNIGSDVVSGPIEALISLSTRPYGTDVAVKTLVLGDFLGKQILAFKEIISIPTTVNPGEYYITVYIDSGKDIIETEEGNNIGSIAPGVITVRSADFVISAIPVPEDGGQVIGDGNYSDGTSVDLAAIANDGYTFVEWTEGNTFIDQSPEIQPIANRDKFFVAHFVRNDCDYSVFPIGRQHSPDGGEGDFETRSLSGCAWTAETDVDWIILTSETTGTGNGTISYLLQPNPESTQRIGGIFVQGNRFRITQFANQCFYSLDASAASYSADGGVGSFTVITEDNCSWSATSGQQWINIQTANGTGENTIHYSISPNSGATRTGYINTQGQIFEVGQIGASLNITSASPFPSREADLMFVQNLDAAGGTSPYTWELVSGTLPQGIQLNASNATIGGIPTMAGSYEFRLRVRDSGGQSSEKDFTVSIIFIDNTDPMLTIDPPLTYETINNPISIEGRATDNIGVTRIAWRNHRGGEGTTTVQNPWRIADVNLQNGVNNITVTAYAAAGNSASETLTVTYPAIIVADDKFVIPASSASGYMANRRAIWHDAWAAPTAEKDGTGLVIGQVMNHEVSLQSGREFRVIRPFMIFPTDKAADLLVIGVDLVLRVQASSYGAQHTDRSYIRIVLTSLQDPENPALTDFGNIVPTSLYSDKLFYNSIVSGTDLVIPLYDSIIEQFNSDKPLTLTILNGFELEDSIDFTVEDVNTHAFQAMGPNSDHPPTLQLTVLRLTLTIHKIDSNSIMIQWDSRAAGFDLENSDDLNSGIWSPISTPPEIVGQNYSVTLSTTSRERFYRLKAN